LLEPIFPITNLQSSTVLRFSWCGEALPKTKQIATNTSKDKETPVSDKRTFYQFVSERMSHADFNTLHEKLGFTKRKTTTYLYRPCKIDFSLLKKLSLILGEDLTRVIHEFQIGAAVYSHKKYQELTKILIEKGE
jgi:hypothetical protein